MNSIPSRRPGEKFSLILFLVLLAFYPQNSMRIMRMRQFINFAFFCYLGFFSPLEGRIVIKIQNFEIYFMFYRHTKFRCNRTTFIFGPKFKGGLGFKNKQCHSSCRKKLHKDRFKKIYWRPCYVRVHTEHKQTHRQTHRPTGRETLNFLYIDF